MLVSTLFEQINSAYRGTDDDVPAVGTVDHDLWTLTTNRKISEWSGDNKNVWRSLFNYDTPAEVGTVSTTATTTLTGTDTFFTDYQIGDTIVVSGETVRTIQAIASDTSLTVTVAFSNTASGKTHTRQIIIQSGVQSYNLNRNYMGPSDIAYVATATDSLEYIIGQPAERTRYNNEVYISGSNPQKLTFQTTITSSMDIVGGTLKLPGYYAPNDITAETDTVPVDDPYWLVYSVASELAFNDLTYEDKAPDLNAKANNLYAGMIANNRRGSNKYPRVAQTNVQRITGVEDSGAREFTS